MPTAGPFPTIRHSIARVPVVELARRFGTPTYVYDAAKIIERMSDLKQFDVIRYAQKARKEGIISLEKEVETASDPFLKRALLMAVDGVDSKTIQETLELELSQMEEHGELPAKVYESAGGYSPTIGILGAVLGLIHVMSNLSDVGKVGEGIAVAFVATIYGVGSANIVFLPAAGKLKLKHKSEMVLREMMMHGALAIQEGQNPKLIEEKLSAFLPHKKSKGKDAAKPEAGASRAAA